MDWCCSQISSSPHRLMPTGSSQNWTSAQYIQGLLFSWNLQLGSTPFSPKPLLSQEPCKVQFCKGCGYSSPEAANCSRPRLQGIKFPPLIRHDGFSPALSLPASSLGAENFTQEDFVQLTWYFTLKNFGLTVMGEIFFLWKFCNFQKSKCWQNTKKKEDCSYVNISQKTVDAYSTRMCICGWGACYKVDRRLLAVALNHPSERLR